MTESSDEVFNSEMAAMSPLVNTWRRKQHAEATGNNFISTSGNNSTSGLHSGWSNASSGTDLRSEGNSDSRLGGYGHGYSSDTEAFLRTLSRRGTSTFGSGQSVSVSGRCIGQPAWRRDWPANLQHKNSCPTSPSFVAKPSEVGKLYCSTQRMPEMKSLLLKRNAFNALIFSFLMGRIEL